MSKIQETFSNLGSKKALVTFVTAGDPDLETTLNIMNSMVDNGVDIIELGIPFSDPMADGPIIQRAAERALKNNVSLNDILNLVQRFRQNNQHTPIVLMGYLNPILAMGIEKFAKLAALSGVDGVLTVDCPIEEVAPLQLALKQEQIDCIFLLAPTTTEDRVDEIVSKASGFLYYVSLTGVTGAGSLNVEQVAQKIAKLRTKTPLPIGVGFGIKDAQSAHDIAQVADAVVIGSTIVQTIENNPKNEAVAVGQLVATLKAAI
ncbi:tryptophan synthase subunit alpha [Neisseria sp. Ec49-e6-T10]|uniref:tryptophan synthase subunit alpha n=1 Tax=Neisseria sp. Ec49-e6-T10 TaxID=3140744 RepID=UPI003EB9A044